MTGTHENSSLKYEIFMYYPPFISEGNIDKISAALSEYLSQLPSLPPGASLPKSQVTDVVFGYLIFL